MRTTIMIGVALLCMTQSMGDEKSGAAAGLWALGMCWAIFWDIVDGVVDDRKGK